MWHAQGLVRHCDFITSYLKQLPTSAWYVLVLVRKTPLLEWAGKLGVQKQMVVFFWTERAVGLHSPL